MLRVAWVRASNSSTQEGSDFSSHYIFGAFTPKMSDVHCLPRYTSSVSAVVGLSPAGTTIRPVKLGSDQASR